MDALISALLTLVGTMLVAYLVQRWTLKAQIRLSDRQKRHQMYGELMGRKFVTTQLYVSRFEAYIFSDYHEVRWKLTGNVKDSLDLQEAKRWMIKSEELALEIAKNNQGLFETVGSIFTVFADSTELKKYIDRLYRFRPPQIVLPELKALAELEDWKVKAVKQLQEFVEEQYAKPIDELLAYLAAEIAKDKK